MRAHFDVRRAGECLRVLHFGSESKRIAKWRNHTHLSFLNASLSALSQTGRTPHRPPSSISCWPYASQSVVETVKQTHAGESDRSRSQVV